MRNAKSRRGLTLIEVAMALAIATLSFLFLARLMADSSSSAQAAAEAKKVTMMAKASQAYLNVEATDLKAFITSPTQVIAIPLARNTQGELPPDGPHATLPSVQKAGLLAAEFIDGNALGQRHVLLVKEPVADKLEGLVVAYGGSAMQDTQLGKLIQSVGMAGGGVFAKDVAPVTATPIANANITGHAGGWTLPVNGWTGASIGTTQITVASGRPVVSLAMMDVADGVEEVQPPTTEESPSDRPTVGEILAGQGYPPPAGLAEWPSAITCQAGAGAYKFVFGRFEYYGEENNNSGRVHVYSMMHNGQRHTISYLVANGMNAGGCLVANINTTQSIASACAETGACEYMPAGEKASDRPTVGEILAGQGYPAPMGMSEWPSAITCQGANVFGRYEYSGEELNISATRVHVYSMLRDGALHKIQLYVQPSINQYGCVTANNNDTSLSTTCSKTNGCEFTASR